MVRTMDLSNNKLAAIPVALGNFKELKQLNAEHNEIGMLNHANQRGII